MFVHSKLIIYFVNRATKNNTYFILNSFDYTNKPIKSEFIENLIQFLKITIIW